MTVIGTEFSSEGAFTLAQSYSGSGSLESRQMV
eukprot:CAMPEP_0201241060 /NCGR_PEP_ID=MMETSP0852-20130820/32255_1 /ASSEMBLY_ACC=CAM_ASM_000632 /TAXON_ID=183588 /ORGANISM="Pseudo-nitzschia fraudulenta, Strain WWA7" /LENGTH=32 /DNA_ID= /DNA_START= /DNA_END= /DNA_ORIENTATION=